MELILDKIDEYLLTQEKCDAITLSLNEGKELKDIIEIIWKSEDKEKIISMFNDEAKEQIQKLIDGGIL